MPPVSRCMVPDDAPPDGALCCTVAPPPAPVSLLAPPAPCAFAKPVPAIRAAAATEIRKRLVIIFLLVIQHCTRRQRERMCDVPVDLRFLAVCFFCECAMNNLR